MTLRRQEIINAIDGQIVGTDPSVAYVQPVESPQYDPEKHELRLHFREEAAEEAFATIPDDRARALEMTCQVIVWSEPGSVLSTNFGRIMASKVAIEQEAIESQLTANTALAALVNDILFASYAETWNFDQKHWILDASIVYTLIYT